MPKKHKGYDPTKTKEKGRFYFVAHEKEGDICATYSVYNNTLLTHCHDFVEILCIVEGEGTHILGGASSLARRGDIFLIDRGEFHNLQAEDGKLSWINVIFRPEELYGAHSAMEIFGKRAGDRAIKRLPSAQSLASPGDDGVSLFRDLLREYDKKDKGYEEILKSYLDIILVKIERQIYEQRSGTLTKGERLIKDVLAELTSTPVPEIKEKELARKYFISPPAFSSIFKRHVGVSFSEYLTSARIKEAIRLLTEEDLPISYVQRASGYTDSKSFYRAFKRYTGTTPLDFKNKTKS